MQRRASGVKWANIARNQCRSACMAAKPTTASKNAWADSKEHDATQCCHVEPVETSTHAVAVRQTSDAGFGPELGGRDQMFRQAHMATLCRSHRELQPSMSA